MHAKMASPKSSNGFPAGPAWRDFRLSFVRHDAMPTDPKTHIFPESPSQELSDELLRITGGTSGDQQAQSGGYGHPQTTHSPLATRCVRARRVAPLGAAVARPAFSRLGYVVGQLPAAAGRRCRLLGRTAAALPRRLGGVDARLWHEVGRGTRNAAEPPQLPTEATAFAAVTNLS